MKNSQLKLIFLVILAFIVVFTLAACDYIQESKKEPEKKPGKLVEETPKTKPEAKKEEPSPEIGDGPEKDHRELTPEAIVKIYGDTIFRNAKTEEKLIALTFDDGIDQEFTPQVLDALKTNDVPGTFFIIGQRTQEHLDILKRMADDGHEIGHHGYHHYKMSNLTPAEIIDELDATNKILADTIQQTSNLFRPPYGAIDPELVETVKEAGYFIILWDIDSLDWRSLSKDQVLDNILPSIHPGAIILQHSAGGPGEDLTGSVQALTPLIQQLKADGYQFVTISELFASKMVNAPQEGVNNEKPTTEKSAPTETTDETQSKDLTEPSKDSETPVESNPNK